MQNDPNGPLAYTINGAANALSVSRASIYRLCNRKELDMRKIGQRTVVTASSVKRLIGEAA